jgi:NAD(P)-dependent dehydrogenase (short-subunit alcohol dehydrogenase family)
MGKETGKERQLGDFSGKTVLVTGASSEIGRAICGELSKRGATLVLMGRDEGSLMETKKMLGGSAHHIAPFDLADHAGILSRVDEVSSGVGPIYGLCHAAGVDQTRPFSACKPDVVQAILNVNLVAGIEIARVICRRNVMTEGGAILFISSIAAHVGVAGRVAYSASKGGIAAAARAMAAELARRKIRVNVLSPGLVSTHVTDLELAKLSKEQIAAIERAHPLGIGTPEDVARAAAFLLSPESLWITGADLLIDGGYTAI